MWLANFPDTINIGMTNCPRTRACRLLCRLGAVFEVRGFQFFRSSGFGAIARASQSGALNASVVRRELGVAVPQVVCGRLAAVFEACL